MASDTAESSEGSRSHVVKKSSKRHRADEGDGSDRKHSHKHKRSSSKRKYKKYKDKEKRRKRHSDDSGTSSSGSDSSSSSASSESSRRHRRKRKHHRKRKHEKKSSRKRLRRQDDKDSDESDDKRPVFGKYGILKASDKQRMQRSFQMWVQEVKGVIGRTSIHEENKLWDEYREDFNTATFPHKKYYDYDAWELREHKKHRIGVSPEEAAALERQRTKAEAEKSLLLATMNSSKIQDMRRQAEMRSQMQAAYKMGDMETYHKLKDKLDAE